MPKKVLILGGARFHGLQLAESLAKKGNDVSVLNRGNFKSDYSLGINHLIADRNNFKDLKKAMGNQNFDIIIDNNAYNSFQIDLISEIIKNKCNHYVFTSSTTIYLKHFSDHNLKENEATGIQEGIFDPKIKRYAIGKFNAEQAIKNLSNFYYTILRFPNIYGEGDFSGKLTFFNEKFRKNRKILLEKEINNFSLIYVNDAINIFENVLGNKKCFGKTINISDSINYNYEKFFNSIYGNKYSKDSLVLMPAQKMWERDYFLPFAWSNMVDISLLKNILGKINYTPIEIWGEKTLDWEIKQFKNKQFLSKRKDMDDLELKLIHEIENV